MQIKISREEKEGGAGACHVFGQTHCERERQICVVNLMQWFTNAKRGKFESENAKTGACHVFGQTHCASWKSGCGRE